MFVGKGRCIACHSVGERHALFTDGRFHNTGIGTVRRDDPARSFTVRLAPGVHTALRARCGQRVGPGGRRCGALRSDQERGRPLGLPDPGLAQRGHHRALHA
ncbi:hypothetical protein LP419_24445 [Massilia sp. H-1]|nr:hypothetical protein LP419_24445 [Massilia sp. H-1]